MLRCAVATFALALAACAHPSAPPAPAADTEPPSDSSGDSSGDESGATPELPPSQPEPTGHFVFTNARLPGGEAVAIEVRDGLIESVSSKPADGVPELDLNGQTVVPGFIDSHVHMVYHFGRDKLDKGAVTLSSGGVVGAVDLAAPIDTVASFDGVRFLAAGPMITADAGYPTQSWGAAGYGLEVSGVPAAEQAVDAVAEAGAKVVKVPVDAGPALSDEELAAVVARAHERGLLVAAHALGDAEAARAAAAGADVLAHTPLETLSDATVEAWSGGAVVSTLRAFGSRDEAVDNVRRLHEAGTRVVYGTDLGNLRVEGIDGGELLLLAQAGLSPADIVAAGTSGPAALWGMSTLGALEPGKAATLLVLHDDPHEDPTVLAEPAAVYVDGVKAPPPSGLADGFGP
ncbi:MAG: amidohydrolase family protein [Myxococcota bacterium]